MSSLEYYLGSSPDVALNDSQTYHRLTESGINSEWKLYIPLGRT